MRRAFATAAVLVLMTTVAARARADEENKSSTKLSATVFADLTYRQNVDKATNLATDKANGTSFDLKRFYLTVDQTWNATWGARFRSDIGNETGGKYDIFVKNAYVEARVVPELTLRAGAADLPWIPFVEGLYGYRYVENVLVDRTKFGTSADWGLHAGGKLGGELASYAISVVNGRGYGDPTRSQSPTAEARLSLSPVKGLTLAAGGLVGSLGQRTVGTATPNTAKRVQALIAYVDGGLRLGAEGFWASDYSTKVITGAAPHDKSIGASVWGAIPFGSTPWSVFARADYVAPNRDTNKDLKDLYANAGVQLKPTDFLSLALAYKYEQVKDGVIATSNGSVGTGTPGKSGTYNEVGLWGMYVY
jgi:hypothetical protein